MGDTHSFLPRFDQIGFWEIALDYSRLVSLPAMIETPRFRMRGSNVGVSHGGSYVAVVEEFSDRSKVGVGPVTAREIGWLC